MSSARYVPGCPGLCCSVQNRRSEQRVGGPHSSRGPDIIWARTRYGEADQGVGYALPRTASAPRLMNGPSWRRRRLRASSNGFIKEDSSGIRRASNDFDSQREVGLQSCSRSRCDSQFERDFNMRSEWAFLTGMGAGVVLGIILAPQSGKETQEYIGRKAQ